MARALGLWGSRRKQFPVFAAAGAKPWIQHEILHPKKKGKKKNNMALRVPAPLFVVAPWTDFMGNCNGARNCKFLRQ